MKKKKRERVGRWQELGGLGWSFGKWAKSF
jgi:hypothetical protein